MYQRNGIWWTRVWTPFGASRRVSTETRDAATAARVEAWVRDVKERLDRHGVLAAVVDGRLTLPQAFVLGERDAATYLAAQDAAAADRTLTDADLSAWVAWTVEEGVSAVVAQDYRRMVEAAWPAPRAVSWLTPRTLIDTLDALPVARVTKGRYRTGFASLCRWLVRRGWLETSPMGSVPGYGQGKPRERWYTREDAHRLLHALDPRYRAAEALMYACGWEWAAVTRALVRDLDLTRMTAFARGTKTAHRQRLTVITDAIVVPWLAEAVAGKLPNAPLFPGLREETVLKAHKAACDAIGLPRTTLHDWRHSYAVLQIQAGRPLHFVAQMLGHANTQLVQTRYGRFALSNDEVEQYAAQICHTASVAA